MTDEEYDEILEEALVDAYGDYEQIESFAVYLFDEVPLPVKGTIANATVRVVGVEAQDTRVVAIIGNDGEKYPVDLMSIDFPETVLPIAAYKKWREGW